MLDTAAPPCCPASAPVPLGRPTWSGLLQLNLVGIPLKAYPALRSRDQPTSHYLHADCGQRLRYAKHCPRHGPVDAAAVVRGYEYGPDQHLVVEPEALDALRPARDRALRLERFLAPSQVDLLLLSGRSLYLVPDGAAAQRGYAVLHAIMAQRQRWALGRVVLTCQRQLVLLRAVPEVFILHVLHYPELVRACPTLTTPAVADATAEMHLAGQLLEAASGMVDWQDYRDQGAAELRALVQAKLAGQRANADDPARMVLPLLEALQQSVAASQQTKPAPAPKESASSRSARAPRSRGRRPA
jgi:DNA end-binding protein Ku